VCAWCRRSTRRAEAGGMPFTLAHPAAILPLRGLRHLRSVPLIIGAMIPDLPYYLPGRLARFIPDTHRFVGSFTTCLLCGYATLAVLILLRRPLTALLSARARALCLAAVAPFGSRGLEWAFAAPAIVLGVWTHLLWDSFTHIDGWAVRRVEVLSAPVTIGSYTSTVCHVLQYLSSALGLAVLAVWYSRLPAPAAASQERPTARTAVAPVLLLIAAAAILIGAVQATEYYSHTEIVYGTFDILLTRSLAWFALLYLVGGAIVTLEHAHERVSS